MVKSDTVFIIILIIILIISVVFTILPVLSGVAKNKCIITQYDYFNRIGPLMDFAKEKGIPYQNYVFKVMYCTECVWFNSTGSEWVIKFVKDSQLAKKNVSYSVYDVPINLNDCSSNNMKTDKEFTFEIGENYVKCLNCL